MTLEQATEEGRILPATMRAVWQEAYGTPEVLELVTGVPRPAPASDEVLIEVHAAGVSRGVLHLVNGTPRMVRLAFGVRKPRQPIPGMDVCGTVIQTGSAVRDLQIGQRVFGDARGSYAEYATAKATRR